MGTQWICVYSPVISILLWLTSENLNNTIHGHTFKSSIWALTAAVYLCSFKCHSNFFRVGSTPLKLHVDLCSLNCHVNILTQVGYMISNTLKSSLRASSAPLNNLGQGLTPPPLVWVDTNVISFCNDLH